MLLPVAFANAHVISAARVRGAHRHDAAHARDAGSGLGLLQDGARAHQEDKAPERDAHGRSRGARLLNDHHGGRAARNQQVCTRHAYARSD